MFRKSIFRFITTTRSKETLTALGKELIGSIEVSGPLSMSHFMRSCLVHPKTGFYMNKDVFGIDGDFITSPEISQVFCQFVLKHFRYLGN